MQPFVIDAKYDTEVKDNDNVPTESVVHEDERSTHQYIGVSQDTKTQ